jgi:hypothetical protein
MAIVMQLSDGSLIMGEVEESPVGKKALTIKNPVEIVVTLSSDDSFAFYGRVWMPFLKNKEVTVNADHVISFGTPSDKVVKYYMKIINTPEEQEVKPDYDSEELAEALNLLAKQRGKYH